MEHELFQYKLKPSVNGALISDIIRSSSSGLNSYRAAAMVLIIERSIQERRERMFTKAKNNLWPDHTPQPERTYEELIISIPEVQPPPAPQLPSRSLPNVTAEIITSCTSASVNHEASQEPPPPSKPAKQIKKVEPREGPPVDVKTNSSSSVDFMELACCKCGVKKPRSSLWSGVYCSLCPSSWGMKCVGCGTIRRENVDACIGCHGKFK